MYIVAVQQHLVHRQLHMASSALGIIIEDF